MVDLRGGFFGFVMIK